MNVDAEKIYIQKSLVIQGSIGMTSGLEIRATEFRIVRVNSRVEALKNI